VSSIPRWLRTNLFSSWPSALATIAIVWLAWQLVPPFLDWALVRALCAAYPDLSPARVVGHSDVAPGRKTDPGEAFDWRRMRALLEAPQEALT